MATKYKLSWKVKGHIVHAKMIETMLTSEYGAFDADVVEYLNNASGVLVHFIFEMTDGFQTSDLKDMSRLEFSTHPAKGWSIMIGQMNPVTNFMITMAAKVNRARFKVLDSVDEAIDFLYSVDANLPPRI